MDATLIFKSSGGIMMNKVIFFGLVLSLSILLVPFGFAATDDDGVEAGALLALLGGEGGETKCDGACQGQCPKCSEKPTQCQCPKCAGKVSQGEGVKICPVASQGQSPKCGATDAQSQCPKPCAAASQGQCPKPCAKAPTGFGGILKSMRFYGSIQALATAREKDDWYGPDEIPNEKSGFRVNRARLGLKGHLIDGNIVDGIPYAIGFNFQIGSGREVDPTDDLDVAVLDAYGWISIDPGEKIALLDPFVLEIGAGKVPFSRAQLTSSKKLNFIFRPWVVEALAPDRDAGISLESGLRDGFVKYYVGVHNGKAESNESIFQGDDNDEVMFSGRLEINPFGPVGCTFGDDLKVSLGGGFFYNQPLEAEVAGYTFDAYARIWRVSVEGGYINVTIEPDIAGEAAPVVLEELEKEGFYVQGGVFVWPKKVELVARYETFEDNLQPEYTEDLHYVTAGVNWYFKASQKNKLQLSYIIREEDDWGTGDIGDIDNNAFMAQFQFAF